MEDEMLAKTSLEAGAAENLGYHGDAQLMQECVCVGGRGGGGSGQLRPPWL
jgi:hypothetical protein